jgi:hypothetical protein
MHYPCQVYIFSVWRPTGLQLYIIREVRKAWFLGIQGTFQRYQFHTATTENNKVRLEDSDGLTINEVQNETNLGVYIGWFGGFFV